MPQQQISQEQLPAYIAQNKQQFLGAYATFLRANQSGFHPRMYKLDNNGTTVGFVVEIHDRGSTKYFTFDKERMVSSDTPPKGKLSEMTGQVDRLGRMEMGAICSRLNANIPQMMERIKTKKRKELGYIDEQNIGLTSGEIVGWQHQDPDAVGGQCRQAKDQVGGYYDRAIAELSGANLAFQRGDYTKFLGLFQQALGDYVRGSIFAQNFDTYVRTQAFAVTGIATIQRNLTYAGGGIAVASGVALLASPAIMTASVGNVIAGITSSVSGSIAGGINSVSNFVRLAGSLMTGLNAGGPLFATVGGGTIGGTAAISNQALLALMGLAVFSMAINSRVNPIRSSGGSTSGGWGSGRPPGEETAEIAEEVGDFYKGLSKLIEKGEKMDKSEEIYKKLLGFVLGG